MVAEVSKEITMKIDESLLMSSMVERSKEAGCSKAEAFQEAWMGMLNYPIFVWFSGISLGSLGERQPEYVYWLGARRTIRFFSEKRVLWNEDTHEINPAQRYCAVPETSHVDWKEAMDWLIKTVRELDPYCEVIDPRK